MKKKLFYITGVCALLALQTACSPQFEDLFDKSASERLEEAMDDAESVLTAADKGWAMGYFPNTETRGYVLFAKFNTDGTVTLTDYNNGGLSSTSTYSMNTSQGPVLNFDTYSEVLGHYTDPGTWLGGSTGNAGDFEFVIFNVTEDEVILKGKKYHADTPEDLYERMRITLDLKDEINSELPDDYEKVAAFSFPMRYIPLSAHERGYVGSMWNAKYLRAVQRMLVPTQGKGVCSRSFFEADFGKSRKPTMQPIITGMNWSLNFIPTQVHFKLRCIT